MPYVDIGTYEGFIPEEKKKEIALKVRKLVAEEIGRPEKGFVITNTGVPEADWMNNLNKIRSEKEVLLDIGE